MTIQLDRPAIEPDRVKTGLIRKIYSIEEFEALSLPEGYRYELVKGELHKMGATGNRHGRLVGRFHTLIDNYLEEHPVGVVWPTTGFIVDKSNLAKPTVRVPDVGFVKANRLPPLLDEKVIDVVPDLAIEVVSPTDRWADVEDKIAEYLKYGVRLIWVIRPRGERVEVYRQGESEPILLGVEDELDGGEVLKGFKIKVSRLFEFKQPQPTGDDE